jgi:hypothetical protein
MLGWETKEHNIVDCRMRKSMGGGDDHHEHFSNTEIQVEDAFSGY